MTSPGPISAHFLYLCPMIHVGEYNTLKVKKELEFGLILEDGKEGILLPKRFVPRGARIGDELKVFLYHDGEDRLIATTQHPKATLGEIAKLRVVSTTPHGAFLDWGLMKDLFVPKSKQLSGMRLGGDYLVRIYLDEQTGRLAATENLTDHFGRQHFDRHGDDGQRQDGGSPHGVYVRQRIGGGDTAEVEWIVDNGHEKIGCRNDRLRVVQAIYGRIVRCLRAHQQLCERSGWCCVLEQIGKHAGRDFAAAATAVR